MLNHMSLRTRLVMLIAAPLLLFLVLGITVIGAVKAADDRLVRNVYDKSYTAASVLHDAETELLLAKEALHRMIGLDALSEAHREQAILMTARLAAAEARVKDAARIVSDQAGSPAGELAEVSGHLAMAAGRIRDWQAAVAPLAEPVRIAPEAGRLELEYRLAGLEPMFDAARHQVERAGERLDEAVRHSVESSRSRNDGLFLALVAIMLAAAASLAVFGAFVIRSVRSSLSEVVGLASAAAAVELHTERSRVEREPDRLDELGRTLGQLSDSLDRLVGAAGRIALHASAVRGFALPADSCDTEFHGMDKAEKKKA